MTTQNPKQRQDHMGLSENEKTRGKEMSGPSLTSRTEYSHYSVVSFLLFSLPHNRTSSCSSSECSLWVAVLLFCLVNPLPPGLNSRRVNNFVCSRRLTTRCITWLTEIDPDGEPDIGVPLLFPLHDIDYVWVRKAANDDQGKERKEREEGMGTERKSWRRSGAAPSGCVSQCVMDSRSWTRNLDLSWFIEKLERGGLLIRNDQQIYLPAHARYRKQQSQQLAR